jgi:predicted nucleic acid-binding protein
LYAVYKRLALLIDTDTAQTLINDILTGRVVEIDQVIALEAAQLALEYKLAMADSLILAAAHLHSATLWPQDEHFKAIPGVSFISKESKPGKTK